MNKRVLKSYLKGSKRELLETCCFEFDNGYIISDSYSVIKLNEPNDLKVEKDIMGVCKFYDNFKWNFEDKEEIEFRDIEIIDIDDEFGIQVKLLKKIKNIIKGNKITILENKDKMSYLKYIIKVENTETNEVGYMLPMRKF